MSQPGGCDLGGLSGRPQYRCSVVAWSAITVILASCGQEALIRKARQDPSSLLIVDCKLPPQVRSVGLAMNYIAPGQAIKTTAIDCGIRGGEFVAYDRANYATALNVWLSGAESGNPEAQTNVGEIYEKGLGTAPNYAEAARWYQKAAAQGYSRAQISLGYLYEQGLGVPKDKVTALNWYRKASGLTEDLALATSFGGDSRQEVVRARAEADTLRSELAQSRQEIESLRRRLGTSETELEGNRAKLRQTLDSLERKRSEVENLRTSSPEKQQHDLPKVLQEVKATEADALREREKVRRLADQYQRQNDDLVAQLKAAEQHAASLNSELDKNRFETARLQTQLTQSEARLETLKLEYETRERVLASPPTLAQEGLKLKSLEAQLSVRDSELAAQRARASELEREVARLDKEKAYLERQSDGRAMQDSDRDAVSRQLAAALELQRVEQQKASELQRRNATLTAERDQLLAEKKRQRQAPTAAREGQAGRDLDREKRLQSLESQFAQRDRELQTQQARADDLQKEIARLSRDKATLEQQVSGQSTVRDQSLQGISMQLTAVMEKQAQERKKTVALERQNDQLVAERDRLAAAQREQTGRRDAELTQLAEQIAKQEQERARLEAALKTAQAQSPTPLQVTDVGTAGEPRIAMQDPQVNLTRNVAIPAVTLHESVGVRRVTGNAYAPAGIASFTVNDRSETVNPAGVFTSEIRLTKKETPVTVTLVDKRGRRATLDFRLILPDGAAAGQSADEALPPDLDFGAYYALVIGNNQYAHLPQLATPISDATAVGSVLKDKYGFAVTQLNNGTRYDILSALNKLRDTLKEKDNLLIYYAGHGELDKVNQQGQWLPVDAEQNNTANWIPTDAVTALLNQIAAKHILVIADSCYAGAMTRASLASLKTGISQELKVKWIRKMLQNKSRTVLTSGGLAPVLESGAGGHSIFAQTLIDALRTNNSIVQGQDLFRLIGDKVKQAAERYRFEQTPQYAPIRYTDHEASDFFFVPKASST